MATFRGGSGWTNPNWPSGSTGTADTTTWAFHEPTGLLASKTDAAGRTVSYTYTQARQIAARTWARGVVTNYAYSSTTGELLSVDYSDSTPDLTYTYNRLGQTATVADYTGTRTFTYNLGGTLELQVEQLSGFYNSYRLDYGYDTATGTKGRLNRQGLGYNGNPYSIQDQTFAYFADGRLSGTTALATGHPSQSFTYTYTANSHLIGSTVNTTLGYTDVRTYDPYHNWLDARVTSWGAATKASFGYTQDNLGRVTQIGKTGELYSRYGNGTQGLWTNFTYNDRSELTSEETKLAGTSTVLTGRSDVYGFDNLGNRSSFTHNGNTATYTTNNLNQYTSKTVPGVFDVAGAAASGATVTVNGSSSGVTRHGEYFFKGHGLNNNPNAVYTTLAISDGSSSANLAAFLAGTPEGMNYDVDGNMLSDGKLMYVYDAENRVTWLQVLDSAVSAGHPKLAWHIFYDYLGRRVLKHHYSWNGSTRVTAAPQERYIYRGWNLIARLDDGALAKHAFWGLDLSGTMAGAGGVGGLLMVQEGGNSYLPAYDALGNVHAMIKASDGSIAAAYEYDAFGQTLRESGPYAASNPFRFATKYADTETGLIHYDTRPYSPSLARFISRDTIGEEGGLNLYAYVLNSPTNHWDYLGMDLGEATYERQDVITLPPVVVTATRVHGDPYAGGWFYYDGLHTLNLGGYRVVGGGRAPAAPPVTPPATPPPPVTPVTPPPVDITPPPVDVNITSPTITPPTITPPTITPPTIDIPQLPITRWYETPTQNYFNEVGRFAYGYFFIAPLRIVHGSTVGAYESLETFHNHPNAVASNIASTVTNFVENPGTVISDYANGFFNSPYAGEQWFNATTFVITAGESSARLLTTRDGFFGGSIQITTPFDIPVQRFGRMSLVDPGHWAPQIGPNRFITRTFSAVKPEWNQLTDFTTGVIPRGTRFRFGLTGTQNPWYRHPGGLFQFVLDNRNVANQASRYLPWEP